TQLPRRSPLFPYTTLFRSGSDHVQMPPFDAFRDAESYYAVLAHECTHWTMPASRLDRSFGRKRWGDEGYAMEELVAELGSAFLRSEEHTSELQSLTNLVCR